MRRGQKHTPESKAKISEKTREVMQRPGVAAKLRGRKRSPEAREKISAALLGKKRGPHSPEAKARISETLRGRKRSPEHTANLSAALRNPRRESELATVLDRAGITYARQVRIGRYTVDFLIEGKFAVEIQGCNFHACESCGREHPFGKTREDVRANDAKRLSTYEAAGYVPIELWEHELRSA